MSVVRRSLSFGNLESSLSYGYLGTWLAQHGFSGTDRVRRGRTSLLETRRWSYLTLRGTTPSILANLCSLTAVFGMHRASSANIPTITEVCGLSFRAYRFVLHLSSHSIFKLYRPNLSYEHNSGHLSFHSLVSCSILLGLIEYRETCSDFISSIILIPYLPQDSSFN